jgi:hypothetical protein
MSHENLKLGSEGSLSDSKTRLGSPDVDSSADTMHDGERVITQGSLRPTAETNHDSVVQVQGSGINLKAALVVGMFAAAGGIYAGFKFHDYFNQPSQQETATVPSSSVQSIVSGAESLTIGAKAPKVVASADLGIVERTPEAVSAESMADENVSPKEFTGDTLVAQLRKQGLYPTPADFEKPVYPTTVI